MEQSSVNPHILIAESRAYPEISEALVKGTMPVLIENGCTYERVTVPGADAGEQDCRDSLHRLGVLAIEFSLAVGSRAARTGMDMMGMKQRFGLHLR